MTFALTPTERYLSVLAAYRWPVVIALVTLVLLAVHHLWFSVSRDSSFSVSLALASIPLLTLLTLLLDSKLVFRIVFWLVALCTGYAAMDFLLTGTRAYFPLADPNNFVTLLYLVWVPWLHQQFLAKANRSVDLLVVGVASFAFGLALLATESRFALFVLLVGAVYWWLGVAFAGLNVRRIISATVGAACAGALFFSLSGAPAAELADVAQEIQSVTASQADGAMVARLALLESAWQLITQHGAGIGTGIYTFSLFYPGVRSVLEQDTAGLFVHNDYVQLFMEGGVLLTLPLLIVLVWVAAVWLKSLFSWRIWSMRHGYLAALSFTLMHALVNFTFYILPVAFLIGVVLANVFAAEPEAEAQTAIERGKSAAWLLRGGLLASGLWVSALLGLDAMTYAVFSGQQGMPFSGVLKADAQAQAAYAETAIRLNPDRGIPQYARARLLEAHAAQPGSGIQHEDVHRAYELAVQTDPYNPELLHQFAQHLRRQGQVVEAGVLLSRAVQLDPANADIALSAIDLELGRNDRAAALTIAAGAMQWCELLARRNPQALDRLGSGIRPLVDAGSASHRQALAACRVHRQQAQATQRESVWLMRLFNP
ncbi:MAG: O-antigen ligase family protein [Pseudomonadales bacterium]